MELPAHKVRSCLVLCTKCEWLYPTCGVARSAQRWATCQGQKILLLFWRGVSEGSEVERYGLWARPNQLLPGFLSFLMLISYLFCSGSTGGRGPRLKEKIYQARLRRMTLMDEISGSLIRERGRMDSVFFIPPFHCGRYGRWIKGPRCRNVDQRDSGPDLRGCRGILQEA